MSSNLLWYLCMAIIGVVVTGLSVYLKRNIYTASTLLAFYLFAAGTTWIGEFIVLGLFNSYAYKTGVYESPWAQNILGHLILNTTLYPTAAVVMAAFSLGAGWVALVTSFFLGAEYLFIKMGLYEQHWWRYYMTAITAIIFLAIAKYCFNKLIKKPEGAIRTLMLYFIAMIVIHTPAPVLLLMGKLHYQLGIVNNIFNELYLSSTVIIFFYHLIEAFIAVAFTCMLKKGYWRAVPFAVSIVVQSIFAKLNILVFSEGWGLFHTLWIYEIFIAAFMLIEKFTLRPGTIRSAR